MKMNEFGYDFVREQDQEITGSSSKSYMCLIDFILPANKFMLLGAGYDALKMFFHWGNPLDRG